MQKRVYIVGAHSRAQTLKTYLVELFPDISIEAYLVNNLSENDSAIEGIPVLKLAEDSSLDLDYPAYIATRSIYHEKLKAELLRLGVKKVIPITADFDMKLRNCYIRKVYKKNGKDFCKIDEMNPDCDSRIKIDKSAKIYVVVSVNDSFLQKKYELTEDEVIIQAGAALNNDCIDDCTLSDAVGDNISEKNRQYCELTVLYWIWKNATEDIVGLAHYRRHFLLPEDWLMRMENYKIDVILPVPLYVGPSIEANFKMRHIASDWEFLMQYLEEYYPEDFVFATKVFQGNFYSPCNMFIMRKEVLSELCSWLFPILDAVTVHGGQKEDPYLNRYPGFISERLITCFFERHREKYQVVYADKNFLT